jgi:hypothetical protein
MGSRDYTKKVTKPEIGVCLDLLHHPAIDRYGSVSICVRFDPEGLGRIGNVNEHRLDDILNGPRRQSIINGHLQGHRSTCGLCHDCDFWGVPTG